MNEFIAYILMCVSLQSANLAFLNPPEIIKVADDNYQSTDTRKFEGIPSLAIAPSGRLWVTWYAGKKPGEDHNNYVVLATSGDDGQHWDELFIIDPDRAGPVRAFDPEVWVDPMGRVWLFWAQAIKHDGTIAGVWTMVTENPDSHNPKWSPPKRLTDGVMMCKPTVISCGKWLLPASTWRKTDNSARVIASMDNGKKFELMGRVDVPVKDRNYDEHMIVERKDGSLWMLVRTKYGIGESVSTDKGRTWSNLMPSPIKHPNARFFIRRLDSGNLLIVKHGPIDKVTERTDLTAFLSKDDGKTWLGGLLLDDRNSVSYPDGQQASDGTIYITYDYSRKKHKEILMACFTEKDILAGKPVSNKVRLQVLVNKKPGAKPHQHTKP